MFINNKYTKCYFRLIEFANSRKNNTGYTEKHHIIPRCFGGSNDQSNLVTLTAREHFIVHLLLTKMVEGTNRRKMTYALLCFNRSNVNHNRLKFNSHTYEYVKTLLSTTPVSAETRAKISKANTGKKRPESVSIAISKAHTGKIVSTETRAKQRAAKLGNIIPISTREKMSIAAKGRVFSQSHCRNIAAAYVHSDIRAKAIAEANKNKRKPCTIDGIKIYESKLELEKILGRGKQGSRSSTFRFIGD